MQLDDSPFDNEATHATKLHVVKSRAGVSTQPILQTGIIQLFEAYIQSFALV